MADVVSGALQEGGCTTAGWALWLAEGLRLEWTCFWGRGTLARFSAPEYLPWQKVAVDR